jgi:hypothetical protein
LVQVELASPIIIHIALVSVKKHTIHYAYSRLILELFLLALTANILHSYAIELNILVYLHFNVDTVSLEINTAYVFYNYATSDFL